MLIKYALYPKYISYMKFVFYKTRFPRILHAKNTVSFNSVYSTDARSPFIGRFPAGPSFVKGNKNHVLIEFTDPPPPHQKPEPLIHEPVCK